MNEEIPLNGMENNNETTTTINSSTGSGSGGGGSKTKKKIIFNFFQKVFGILIYLKHLHLIN